jgi:hypothetical protein
VPVDSMPLEVLDRSLVFLGRFTRLERSQISPLSRLGILFPGIESILSGRQLSDHGSPPRGR